jgi:hypothetical protein
MRLAIAIPFVALAAGAAAAQEPRVVTAARQLHAGDSLRVVVSHSAGPLRVRATEAALLYDVALRYDPSRASLVRAFDPATHTLRVGVDSADAGLRFRLSRGVPEQAAEHPNTLTLALGRGVPLDLALEFGASEASLDLTGLTVERLAVKFGASDTHITFGAPNPARMRALTVSAGAGSLTIRGLGNANAPRVEITGVAAGLDLDLSGEWAHDMELDADVVLGGLVLRVPSDVGVRVVMRRDLLASVETPGLVRRDDVRVSANWDAAPRKLTLTARAILGGLELHRSSE